jgi:hypothetical protein
MKEKFDKWILSLDHNRVTSNLYFFLAVINILMPVYFGIFLFLGIMYRYVALKADQEKAKPEETVEETEPSTPPSSTE